MRQWLIRIRDHRRRELVFAALCLLVFVLILTAYLIFTALSDTIRAADMGLFGIFYGGLVMHSVLGWARNRLDPLPARPRPAMALTVRKKGTVYNAETLFGEKDGQDFMEIVQILRAQADLMEKMYRDKISKAN